VFYYLFELWMCIAVWSLKITKLSHRFSCMFISILYMIRAAMCPLSRELFINATPGLCQSMGAVEIILSGRSYASRFPNPCTRLTRNLSHTYTTELNSKFIYMCSVANPIFMYYVTIKYTSSWLIPCSDMYSNYTV
jgi:hypothetical protein